MGLMGFPFRPIPSHLSHSSPSSQLEKYFSPTGKVLCHCFACFCPCFAHALPLLCVLSGSFACFRHALHAFGQCFACFAPALRAFAHALRAFGQFCVLRHCFACFRHALCAFAPALHAFARTWQSRQGTTAMLADKTLQRSVAAHAQRGGIGIDHRPCFRAYGRIERHALCIRLLSAGSCPFSSPAVFLFTHNFVPLRQITPNGAVLGTPPLGFT